MLLLGRLGNTVQYRQQARLG